MTTGNRDGDIARESEAETKNDDSFPQRSDFATIMSSLNLASPFEYHMPAEWEKHSACLILFPHNPDTFRVEKASDEIIELAISIATVGKEDVYLLCKSAQDVEKVSKKLFAVVSERRKSDVNFYPRIFSAICPSNDTWARDTGPTFVKRKSLEMQSNGQNELVGLDWEFNAYGGPEEGCYWPCTDDRKIARLVCSKDLLSKPVVWGENDTHNSNNNSSKIDASSIAKCLSIKSSISIPMILEGGSIHTDGEGTLLTTSECLLHPNRNPHLEQKQIEEILKLSLGVSKVLWLPFGLDADNDTNGHVDNFCCFVRPGHVILAWTDCDDDDTIDDISCLGRKNLNNYKRCRAAYEYLQSTKDAKGRAMKITKLYLPTIPLRYTEKEALSIGTNVNDHTTEYIRYPGERMAASYINFYIANKAVFVPQFSTGVGDDNKGNDLLALAETDRMAIETLRPIFPDRTVIGIPSREILLGGGNIHCQTQQVPWI